MSTKLLLVDDHVLVRQALARVIALDNSFEIVGEAGNGFDAIALAKQTHPDAVLMDLYMPGMDGVAATRLIKRDLPDVKVIILSASLEESDLVGSVQAGARGYILKTTDAASFLKQLKQAVSGGVALSDSMMGKLLTGLASGGAQQHSNPEVYGTLTPREKAVLGLISHGKANKDIAAELFVSVNTVRAHVRGLMQKVNMENRTQLAIFGIKGGFGVPTTPASGNRH